MFKYIRRVIDPLLAHSTKRKIYAQYVVYSMLSNVFATTESVLSTHSMLNTMQHNGVGSLITTSYIGKDIFGQLGGLWYMFKKGNQIDRSPQKTINRMLLFQQLSYIIESSTPLLSPGYFLPLASIANIGINISFTGIGAVNAKIIQSCCPDHVGESYATISVLNTLGSSFGMLLGLGIITKIPDHFVRLSFIPVLGCLRVYTYKKAVPTKLLAEL